MTAVPKPVRAEKTPKRLRPVNPERVAAKRLRNFPTPDLVPQFCLIAHKLAEYRARHGEKSTPAGWSRCWGPVDPAHVTPRHGAPSQPHKNGQIGRAPGRERVYRPG